MISYIEYESRKYACIFRTKKTLTRRRLHVAKRWVCRQILRRYVFVAINIRSISFQEISMFEYDRVDLRVTVRCFMNVYNREHWLAISRLKIPSYSTIKLVR